MVNHVVSITDIALGLGFGSLSTFSTTFGKRFGVTPSELRELPAARPRRVTGLFSSNSLGT
ncbi:AraC family transcriptional regulator [Nocardia sp. NPDC020380]|uniref:AraC family transcriptional regulator n=1 Tax=Nocardia sp. NPDC020380 TaxID=3364309 RepID=UPI0037954DCB